MSRNSVRSLCDHAQLFYPLYRFLGAIVGSLLGVAPWGFDEKKTGKTYKVERAAGGGPTDDGTADKLSYAEYFFVEAIFTCLLVSTVLHLCTVTTGKLDVGRDIFGFAIGVVVSVGILGGTYAGVWMNPAVALGRKGAERC